MLPDRVSNPGPLTYESGALPIALRGPARVGDDYYAQAPIFYLVLSIQRPEYGAAMVLYR